MESALWGDPARPTLVKSIESPRKGVTEFMVHPVKPSEELFAYDTESADSRVADAEALMDGTLRSAIVQHGVSLIGFRPLREAMRGGDVKPGPVPEVEPTVPSAIVSPDLPAAKMLDGRPAG